MLRKESAVLPPGGSWALTECAEKMSEVLAEFAEPLFEYSKDDEMACALAAIAWNASLLPREEWPRLLERAAELVPAKDPEARDGLKGLLAAMMLWKRERYPDNQRMILSYEIVGSGEQRVLNVLSTPQPDRRREQDGGGASRSRPPVR